VCVYVFSNTVALDKVVMAFKDHGCEIVTV